jgi:hypothetical protein
VGAAQAMVGVQKVTDLSVCVFLVRHPALFGILKYIFNVNLYVIYFFLEK